MRVLLLAVLLNLIVTPLGAEPLLTGDRFVPVPTGGLTAKNYAAALRRDIHPDQATRSDTILHGHPIDYESNETTHFSIVDRNGNTVSNAYGLVSVDGTRYGGDDQPRTTSSTRAY